MTLRRLNLAVTQLKVSDRNVRRCGPGDVTELAATIAALGLIHPLKVLAIAEPRGKITHEIIAGSRRYAAVRLLIKTKRLPKTYALRCDEIGAAEAEAISLAENIERADMHPADEFEAFQRLIDQGASVAGVAAKFGMADSAVAKRLRLARVAPEIFAAFRAGQIDLEQIMAYAVTDDRARQMECFSTAPIATPAWKIKQALTEGQIPSSDKRVRFVGIDAYGEAGGAFYADLFSYDERDSFLTDGALLDRLVADKLDLARRDLAAEGWRWTECAVDGFDHAAFPRRLYPRPVAVAAAMEDRPDDEALPASYDEVAETIDAPGEQGGAFAAEDIARSGAIVTIDHQGRLRIERGLLRKADVRREKADAGGLGGATVPATPALSDALTRELSWLRTGMIAATLAGNPHLAQVAMTHALALPLFYPGAGNVSSCLAIGATESHAAERAGDTMAGRAFAALSACRGAWKERLPTAPEQFWAWCASASDASLQELLATCCALTVDGGVEPRDHRSDGRHVAADQLADALAVKASDWCGLSDLNLFPRATKAFTLDVVRREVGADRADSYVSMKKDEIARRATIALDGKWLPDGLLQTAQASEPAA